MKIKGLLFSLLLLATVSSYADVKGYQKILGQWDISAPTAPQPYDTGTLNLTEVEKKLTGEFIIDGQAVEIPSVQYDDGILTLKFEVENTDITLELKVQDGLMEGGTDTPNGRVLVKAKPKTK
jgi:hypothetical protein